MPESGIVGIQRRTKEARDSIAHTDGNLRRIASFGDRSYAFL